MSESVPNENPTKWQEDLLERIVTAARRTGKNLSQAAFEMIGWSVQKEGPDYLDFDDEDYRLVMAFVEYAKRKPQTERSGWEEIWLPRAVADQCLKDEDGNPILDKKGGIQPRVTRAQTDRLLATLAFRARQSGGNDD